MKTVVKVWNALTTLLTGIVLILAVLLVGVRVFGYRPMYVMSGSMEPAYPVGSLIFVKPVDPAEIRVGDVITCTVSEAGDYVTHRVIGIESREMGVRSAADASGRPVFDESGEPVYEEYPLEETCYYFQTRGDANETADGQLIHYKNVAGMPRMVIPCLGYAAWWLQTTRGRILGVSAALALLILTFLPDLLKWKR